MRKKLIPAMLACFLLSAGVPAKASWLACLHRDSCVRKTLRLLGAVGLASYASDRALNTIRLLRTFCNTRMLRDRFPNLWKESLKNGAVSAGLSAGCFFCAYKLYKTLRNS